MKSFIKDIYEYIIKMKSLLNILRKPIGKLSAVAVIALGCSEVGKESNAPSSADNNSDKVEIDKRSPRDISYEILENSNKIARNGESLEAINKSVNEGVDSIKGMGLEPNLYDWDNLRNSLSVGIPAQVHGAPDNLPDVESSNLWENSLKWFLGKVINSSGLSVPDLIYPLGPLGTISSFLNSKVGDSNITHREALRRSGKIVLEDDKLMEDLYQWQRPVSKLAFQVLSPHTQEEYTRVAEHVVKYLEDFDYATEEKYLEDLGKYDIKWRFTFYNPNGDEAPMRKIEAQVFRRTRDGWDPKKMGKWTKRISEDLKEWKGEDVTSPLENLFR